MVQVRFELPAFTAAEAARVARECYGLTGVLTPLPSERDQNFKIAADTGDAFVLKVANAGESVANLELQNRVLEYLAARVPELAMPRLVRTETGEAMTGVEDAGGTKHLVRMLTFVPGQLWAEIQPHSPKLRRSLGRALGLIDAALSELTLPGVVGDLKWDLTRAGWIREYLHHLAPDRRQLVERLFAPYDTHVAPRLAALGAGLIHNDANDHNIVVRDGRVVSLIDYGDMAVSPRVCELAIGIAYAIMDAPDALAAAADVVAGYHQVLPLTEAELEVLFALICARLCVSVTNAAYQRSLGPHNEYLQISERPAWALLEQLDRIGPALAHDAFRAACGWPRLGARLPAKTFAPAARASELLAARGELLGRNLSLAYREPLHIVRGYLQYLYDAEGRAYLDAVNNVAHVGHGHPRVVRAGQAQMAVLNTNSRYLHEHIVRYAERLVATLPRPLRVCYFVNSGSEANELALRLARTHTRSRATVVLEGAYHGNTSALVEISPYKYAGPGGAGRPDFVRSVPMPDPYRGIYRRDDARAATRYADHVLKAVEELAAAGLSRPAFIAESLMGSSGQIVLPDGFLREASAHVRAAGGVYIADEVQVGFGRVGTHFWGFETQGVVPDIVALGKPIGNGHPMGAVITTPEIAASFDNGMEYFSTFGGNPVSCAIGLAVLDVIEDEGLQANALRVGDRLQQGLRTLANRHALIGDVRGAGLFLGVEFVRDRATLEPAPVETSYITNRLKELGVLVSIDGPLHNVLKIKPPLVFTDADADFFVETLDGVLGETISVFRPAPVTP